MVNLRQRRKTAADVRLSPMVNTMALHNGIQSAKPNDYSLMRFLMVASRNRKV